MCAFAGKEGFLNLNKMGAELYTLTEDFRQCQEDIWKYQCTQYSKNEDEKSTGTKYLQTGWRRRTEHDDEGPQIPGQRVVPKKTTDWVAVGLGLWVVVVLAVGFGLWVVEVLVVGLGLLVLVVVVAQLCRVATGQAVKLPINSLKMFLRRQVLHLS